MIAASIRRVHGVNVRNPTARIYEACFCVTRDWCHRMMSDVKRPIRRVPRAYIYIQPNVHGSWRPALYPVLYQSVSGQMGRLIPAALTVRASQL